LNQPLQLVLKLFVPSIKLQRRAQVHYSVNNTTWLGSGSNLGGGQFNLRLLFVFRLTPQTAAVGG
jgi:hypothetical protein